MTSHTDEQFESVLDEALALQRAGKSLTEILAIFADYADELAPLLSITSDTEGYFMQQDAHASLKKILTAPKPAQKITLSFFKQPFFLELAGIVAVIILVVTAIPRVEPKTTSQESASLPQNNLALITSSAGIGQSNAYQLLKPLSSSDAREFFQTQFGATIETRDVEEFASRTHTIIRGHGGRTDNSTITDESAYITFVVPKNEYEKFKVDITDLAGKHFIHVRENSTNLLSQKQDIENNTRNTEEQLTAAQNTRAEIIRHHEAALKTPEEATLYSNNLNAINQKINIINSELLNLKIENEQFSDTTNTVSGTLSISDISLFGMLESYIPLGWMIAALILSVIIWKKRSRRLVS